MGNGIAHSFAQSGYRVNLIDIDEIALNKALQTISKNLDRMLEKGVISNDQKTSTIKNITTYTDINKGVENTSLVVEAATENEAVKIQIFKILDETSPKNTILATNTSSHFHYQNSSCNQTAWKSYWHAFHESRSHYATCGDYQWI